jgi:hypothetical protein
MPKKGKVRSFCGGVYFSFFKIMFMQKKITKCQNNFLVNMNEDFVIKLKSSKRTCMNGKKLPFEKNLWNPIDFVCPCNVIKLVNPATHVKKIIHISARKSRKICHTLTNCSLTTGKK